jgi:hypothetical protein
MDIEVKKESKESPANRWAFVLSCSIFTVTPLLGNIWT